MLISSENVPTKTPEVVAPPQVANLDEDKGGPSARTLDQNTLKLL